MLLKTTYELINVNVKIIAWYNTIPNKPYVEMHKHTYLFLFTKKRIRVRPAMKSVTIMGIMMTK